MPNFDGSGPFGAGPMTGRGLGPCGGGRAMGPGYGRGRGYGMGYGRGMGYGSGFGRGFAGRGQGPGWAAVGYGPGGDELAAANMRTALEERKAFLRAELARTEALLGESAAGDGAPAEGEGKK